MAHGHITSYEPFAENYLGTIDQYPWNAHFERPLVVSHMGALRNKTVLDLGCGSGFYSAHAVACGASVIAVDISEKTLAHTRKRVGDTSALTTVQADLAEPLHFCGDETVDLIVCSLVLHYVAEWSPVLAELARVLRPGGTVLITTHHPFSDYLRFREGSYFEKRLISDKWPCGNVHYFLRPLRDITGAILNGPLRLRALEEPTPTEEFRAEFPALYEKISRSPNALFIHLTKDER